VFLAAGSAFAAAVGQLESWGAGNTAGWQLYDLVNERDVTTLANDAGALKLTFPKQTMRLPPEEWLVKAGAGASGGAFAGDYMAAGVQALSFRLYCEREATVCVALCGTTSGRVWRFRLSGVRTGEWVGVSVPVDPRALRSVSGEAAAAAFEADLRDVAWVGVSVQRNSAPQAQAYRVDDFLLAGPGVDFAAYMAQYPASGGDLQAHRLATGDLDGDGSDNYSEWVAGTSAGDGTEQLVLRLEREGEGARLRWNSKPGRVYRVWKADSPQGPYEPVGGEVAAEEPENSVSDPAAGAAVEVYRLEVRQAQP